MRPWLLSSWMMLVVACTRLNPAFDDGETGPSEDATSATATASATSATTMTTTGSAEGPLTDTGIADSTSTSMTAEGSTTASEATMGCAGVGIFQAVPLADVFLRMSKSPECGPVTCDGYNYGITELGVIGNKDAAEQGYHLMEFDVGMLGEVATDSAVLLYQVIEGTGPSELTLMEVKPPHWGEGLGNGTTAEMGEASFLMAAVPSPWFDDGGVPGSFGVIMAEAVHVATVPFEASEASTSIEFPIADEALTRWAEGGGVINLVVTKSSGEGMTLGHSRESSAIPTLFFSGC